MDDLERFFHAVAQKILEEEGWWDVSISGFSIWVEESGLPYPSSFFVKMSHRILDLTPGESRYTLVLRSAHRRKNNGK